MKTARIFTGGPSMGYLYTVRKQFKRPLSMGHAIIGRKLKDLRLQAGMSQGEVSRAIGVPRDGEDENKPSHAHISGMETGTRNYGLDRLEKVVNLYGLELDEFLKTLSDPALTAELLGRIEKLNAQIESLHATIAGLRSPESPAQRRAES